MAGKTERFGRLVFKSGTIHRVLERTRKDYKRCSDPEVLVIPYILTCAAYLESKLNDSLLHFGAKKFGWDFAMGLLSLSLPTKLNVFVPVLTDGRYRINKKHFVYQRLRSLITVRNSVAHAKSEFEDITVAPEDVITTLGLNCVVEFPRQFRHPVDDVTLGVSKTFNPLEYHEALDKLEKWFFQRYPNRLTKVAMIVDRSNDRVFFDKL